MQKGSSFGIAVPGIVRRQLEKIFCKLHHLCNLYLLHTVLTTIVINLLVSANCPSYTHHHSTPRFFTLWQQIGSFGQCRVPYLFSVEPSYHSIWGELLVDNDAPLKFLRFYLFKTEMPISSHQCLSCYFLNARVKDPNFFATSWTEITWGRFCFASYIAISYRLIIYYMFTLLNVRQFERTLAHTSLGHPPSLPQLEPRPDPLHRPHHMSRQQLFQGHLGRSIWEVGRGQGRSV